jgi:hypothetical protein
MPLSDYLVQQLTQHWTKIGAYAQPANLYVGLSTADPTRSGAGVAEPVGNGYARTLINNFVWNAGAKRAENNGVITFPTATGAWGTIQYAFIADAAAAGNMLAYGQLPAAKTINNLDVMSFPAAQITTTIL